MADDQCAERLHVGECARKDTTVLNNGIAVGERGGPSIQEKADFSHLTAFASLGQRRHGQYVYR